MTTDPTDPEVAHYQNTLNMLQGMLGLDALLVLSERALETAAPDWHEPGKEPDGPCTCAALNMLVALYEMGWGLLPTAQIAEAGPILAARRHARDRARNN